MLSTLEAQWSSFVSFISSIPMPKLWALLLFLSVLLLSRFFTRGPLDKNCTKKDGY